MTTLIFSHDGYTVASSAWSACDNGDEVDSLVYEVIRNPFGVTTLEDVGAYFFVSGDGQIGAVTVKIDGAGDLVLAGYDPNLFDVGTGTPDIAAGIASTGPAGEARTLVVCANGCRVLDLGNSDDPDDWVAMTGHRGKAEIIAADVSTVSAATDKVLRVRGARGKPDWLSDINFQSGPDASVPRRSCSREPSC